MAHGTRPICGPVGLTLYFRALRSDAANTKPGPTPQALPARRRALLPCSGIANKGGQNKPATNCNSHLRKELCQGWVDQHRTGINVYVSRLVSLFPLQILVQPQNRPRLSCTFCRDDPIPLPGRGSVLCNYGLHASSSRHVALSRQDENLETLRAVGHGDRTLAYHLLEWRADTKPWIGVGQSVAGANKADIYTHSQSGKCYRSPWLKSRSDHGKKNAVNKLHHKYMKKDLTSGFPGYSYLDKGLKKLKRHARIPKLP